MEKLTEIIRNSPRNKSDRPTQIQYKIFRYIGPRLLNLMNPIILTGKIPMDWVTSHVILYQNQKNGRETGYSKTHNTYRNNSLKINIIIITN